MSLDHKPKNILQNINFQEHIKRLTYLTKWSLSQEFKGAKFDLTLKNQCTSPYQLNKKRPI